MPTGREPTVYHSERNVKFWTAIFIGKHLVELVQLSIKKQKNRSLSTLYYKTYLSFLPKKENPMYLFFTYNS